MVTYLKRHHHATIFKRNNKSVPASCFNCNIKKFSTEKEKKFFLLTNCSVLAIGRHFYKQTFFGFKGLGHLEDFMNQLFAFCFVQLEKDDSRAARFDLLFFAFLALFAFFSLFAVFDRFVKDMNEGVGSRWYRRNRSLKRQSNGLQIGAI